MPDIYFKCSCRKSLAVRDTTVGKVFNCPDCGTPVDVPAPDMQIHCACCDNPLLLPRSMVGEEVQCAECKYNMVVPEPSPDQLMGAGGESVDSEEDGSDSFKKLFIGLTTLLLCVLGIWILVEMGADETHVQDESETPTPDLFNAESKVAPDTSDSVRAEPGPVQSFAVQDQRPVEQVVASPAPALAAPAAARDGDVSARDVEMEAGGGEAVRMDPLPQLSSAAPQSVAPSSDGIMFLGELPQDIRAAGAAYRAKFGELQSQRQALLDRINAIYSQCLGQLDEQFQAEGRNSDLTMLREEMSRFSGAMRVGADDVQTAIPELEKFQVMYRQSLTSGPMLKVLQEIVSLSDSYVAGLDAAERRLVAEDNAGAALAVRGERHKALADQLQAEARAIVERVAAVSPPAPPSAAVQQPTTRSEPQAQQPAAATNKLSLAFNWNRSSLSSKSVKDDLLRILRPFGEAKADLERYDEIRIFGDMTYLMDVAAAFTILGERPGPAKPLTTPYFANGSFRYYTVTKDIADGGRSFNRILLVTDMANQLVAVQLVSENPGRRQLHFGNESECSMYNIVQQKKKASSNTHVQFGVAFEGASRRRGWGEESGGDVLRIESEYLQRSGYYDIRSVEFVRLYMPVPIVNLLLHCLETQR